MKKHTKKKNKESEHDLCSELYWMLRYSERRYQSNTHIHNAQESSVQCLWVLREKQLCFQNFRDSRDSVPTALLYIYKQQSCYLFQLKHWLNRLKFCKCFIKSVVIETLYFFVLDNQYSFNNQYSSSKFIRMNRKIHMSQWSPPLMAGSN